MAEQEGLSLYCISEDFCGLCKFHISKNDLVWAFVGDGDIPCQFKFLQRAYSKDTVNIHACLSYNCQFGGLSTTCVHDRCYKFHPYPLTSKLLNATRYYYTPSAAETRHRFRYIAKTLSRRLQGIDSWPRKLPNELWLKISKQLAPEYATCLAQELASLDYCPDATISFERPIYASYIKIENRYYVKRLQNIAEPDSGRTYLLLPAQTKRRGKTDMIIAQDYLGIRQVIFIPKERYENWCCKNMPPPVGTWWKHISGDIISSSLVLISDGIKLREINGPQDNPFHALTQAMWQVPIPSTPAMVDLLHLEEFRDYEPNIRMRVLECNSANITGYSIITDSINILSILTHKDNSVDEGVYDSIDPKYMCIYMPINQGEYLTHICRRTGLMFCPDPEIIGITFSTNKQRTITFGLHAREGFFSTQLIATLPPSPCRLYFNERDHFVNMDAIKVVGIEQTTLDFMSKNPVEPPPVIKPLSACPHTTSTEPWLHSGCSMEQIAEIQLCTRRTSYKPIIGMLINYIDGHTECVGQIRLDWLSKPITLTQTDKIYICGELKRSQTAYISDITTQKPSVGDSNYWLGIAQVGILEWWFSPLHSVLYYDGTRLN